MPDEESSQIAERREVAESTPDTSLLLPWYDVFKSVNKALAAAVEFLAGVTIGHVVLWVLERAFGFEIAPTIKTFITVLVGLSVAVYAVVDFVGTTSKAVRRMVADLRRSYEDHREKLIRHKELREQLDNPQIGGNGSSPEKTDN